jgi:uncharacterized RDD family membrane protein YckC
VRRTVADALRGLLLGALASLLGGVSVHAQTTTTAGEPAGRCLVAATEQALWVLRAEGRETQVYARGVTGSFRPREALYGRVVGAAAGDVGVFGFAGDGAFYSLRNERWMPELNLPPHLYVTDLVASGDDVFVLASSPPAGVLPVEEGGRRPATSQPFDPGGAALSVLRYDNRGWIGVAGCPDRVGSGGTGRLRARLGIVRGMPHVLWYGTEQRIHGVRWDAADGVWRDVTATPDLPGLREFWMTTVSRMPMLLGVRDAAQGGEELVGFRLVGGEDGAPVEWRRVTLELSAMAPGVEALRYEHAVGFNQHVALLMLGSDQGQYVRFARPDGPAAETTLALGPLFSGQNGTEVRGRLLQMAALVVLFGLLVALFVFRRGAMVRVLELPREYLPALTLQRLVAFGIDTIPFLLGAALLLNTNWRNGLQDLFNWAARSDTVSGSMPPVATLVWWGAGTSAYCLYALVMELTLRRTVGKMLTGTRVLAESGQEASALQIVVRNAIRLLELQPPLWILGFLVVLSRNRQRVGDILARTIVVRQVRDAEPPESDQGE